MSVSAPTYIYPPITSDPTSLYQQFVTYMQSQIPGWQPYSGELDDWLARAFAGIQATLSELASDVTTQIFRYFGAYLINLPPYDATSSTGTVTIQVKDANGPYDIPAYTQMSFPDPSGQLQGFETLSDVTVPNGQTEVTGVPVAAMTAGSAGNGCSGNGDLDSTGITFITGLTLEAATDNGTDAEADADYLNRLAQTMTTLSPSPILPADFNVLAGTQAGVTRAFTLPTFNPANWTTTGTTAAGNAAITGIPSTANIPVGAAISGGSIPAGTYVKSVDSSSQITLTAAPTAAATGVTLTITGQQNAGGYVTTWVMGTEDVLDAPSMQAVQQAIQALCLTNITFTVKAPTKNSVAVTASVVAWPNVDPTSVQTAVTAALNSFLAPTSFGTNQNPDPSSPSTVGWLNDNKVRLAVIQNVIMNVPGVHYVSSVQINGQAADLALNGVVPLTTPGTMTITVTNG